MADYSVFITQLRVIEHKALAFELTIRGPTGGFPVLLGCSARIEVEGQAITATGPIQRHMDLHPQWVHQPGTIPWRFDFPNFGGLSKPGYGKRGEIVFSLWRDAIFTPPPLATTGWIPISRNQTSPQR